MKETFTIKGMHVGGNGSEDEDLTFLRQLGIEYVSAFPPARSGVRDGLSQLGLVEEGYWKVDALARWREHVESLGLKLAAMNIPRQLLRSIALGTPERDRDIERLCKCIEAAGKVGIPLLRYHGIEVLPIVIRSIGWTIGRGGIKHKYFDWEDVKDDPPHPAGPISAEQAWERIEYFVKSIIPVAEEYKVRIGCHPNDQPVLPGAGYRGIEPVTNNVDGLKRYIDLHPSPYHGVVFCQGTISEMSTSPEQVYEAIRYFGSRNKIFWVHFRNIRGGFLKFEETFPDEGDIDMAKAMRTYKEIGYNGVLEPDHAPRSDLLETNTSSYGGRRALAFCYGYIKALIQAVESEN